MRKLPVVIAFYTFVILFFSCKTEEVILHGSIKGIVTDSETSDAIEGASINLIQSYDTINKTNTGIDGAYIFKNITPGDYQVQASKYAYGSSLKNIEVTSVQTGEINFNLKGIPVPVYSDTLLDFGVDNTTLSFTISNNGKGKLPYIITASQGWITFNPGTGEVTTEADTIRVTINKTGLSDEIIYKEKIEITSTGGPEPVQDTIGVLLNGLIYAGQTYKIVKIGTQTWMAENLNVGEQVEIYFGITQGSPPYKVCYRDEHINCEKYGGLYYWDMTMKSHTSDSGTIGTTQGICPTGWHVPTMKEWSALIDYLGGDLIAGGKMKETGTDHWLSPNTGATNESGFTALPGGHNEETGIAGTDALWSYEINTVGTFWTATIPPEAPPENYPYGSHIELYYNKGSLEPRYYPDMEYRCSVRCLKDP